MSQKSDASTTTEELKMAPLCLFYFSHPFGILSPNPPSVTIAPDDYVPPTWMSSAFSDRSWNPISFPFKVNTTSDVDSEELLKSFKPPTYEKDTKKYAKTAEYPKQEYRKRDRFSSIESKRNTWTDKSSLENIYGVPKIDPRQSTGQLLPPIERFSRTEKEGAVNRCWPHKEGVSKFRRRSLLPPIDMRCLKTITSPKSTTDSMQSVPRVNLEDLRVKCDMVDEIERTKRRRRKMKPDIRRMRPIRSSRGVNKGRCVPNRSAARKFISYLVHNIAKGRRATTASLPSLSEVLKTVRQAWTSPKSLLTESQGEKFNLSSVEGKVANMGLGQPLLPGASPGLLRRRYSLPETVMRKYRLAQQKSESDDSEACSAPSVWMPNANRDRSSRGRERGPKSVLLRRLWGRDPPPTIGGSHSELRYWDSRSGSSSPRSPDRTCEACKRLSDKNLTAIGKSDIHSPPIYRAYVNRSPKKQTFKCINSSNHSPERYITQTEGSPLRNQTMSPSTLIAGSTASERLSFKSASASESSSKLGLSSLVTSSYPVTSEFTRSSASYSSDDASRSQSNPMLVRPMTASDSVKSSPTHKKRRQSVSSFTTSRDSSTMETKSDVTNTPKDSKTFDSTPQSYTTTTTTSETTSDFHTTTTKRDTTSRSDSAMSSQPEDNSTDFNRSNGNPTMTPSSDERRSDIENNEKHRCAIELSDTGISETIDNDNNKNTESSFEDPINSKDSSVTYSEDYSSNVVTCVEKSINGRIVTPHLECLEVIVSETVNSSMFEGNKNEPSKITSYGDINRNQLDSSDSKSRNRIDIDQYVSNILMDSLNTMTDQINEINSNIEDDKKLNILEKEIKVKLQSVGSSPINLITNPIITTLITSIPDKELLETTVIEEKMRSVAYTTESKLFPLESTIEIESAPLLENFENLMINDDVALDNIKSMEDSLIVDNKEDSPELEADISNRFLTSEKEGLYLDIDNTETPLPYDINENEKVVDTQFEDEKTKAVLRQLHKMFENSSRNSLDLVQRSVDNNFNLCNDGTQAYFCGTSNDNTSHLEMSTDVDIFVDNSLNKMMNSIDINYNNGELAQNTNGVNFNSLNGNLDSSKDNSLNIPELQLPEKSMLSNIGTGSAYEKPLQRPLVVPRFSAIPHSESMEVNTSTDGDELECQSDCLSLVDSLDDPNSPRFLYNEKGVKSKYDKKLVRGDIMTLLPENSNVETKSNREKSEKFFIPIRENSMEVIKENIVVADHMPEKIKARLYQRQQKREMRKEYHRRKKLKQMKKELHRQKKVEEEKGNECDKECLEVLTSLVDQVAKTETKKKIESNRTKVNENDNKKSSSVKKVPQKPVKKDENVLKNIESFVIDKKGNIQTKNVKKNEKKERTLKAQNDNLKIDEGYLYRKNEKDNTIEAIESLKVLKSKVNVENDNYLTGPRRLYQKTEFQEGNKRIEILEIVECIESSPEPSDESQESISDNKRHGNSKIPVLQRISKSKSTQKTGKTCRSPIGKHTPMNIVTAKNDREHYKNTNSKTDQLIANILIDAFNKDSVENSNVQLVLSPREKKSIVKQSKSVPPTQTPTKRLPLQQNGPGTIMPKYKRKFDAIPEEKSSVSIESSNDDANSIASTKKTSSLPINKNSPKKTLLVNRKPVDDVKKDPPQKFSPKKVDNHDVSTSPIPRYISTATSPIPLAKLDERNGKSPESDSAIKGKKALGTKEGWAGFCRPQTRYSPENEGSHPSSNNPSDREAIGKIQKECNATNQTENVAPLSQRVLRTMDSRENIKQISINHEQNKSNDENKDQNKTKPSKKYKLEKNKSKNNENVRRESDDTSKTSENANSTSKSLVLPSPFKNQSFTQSSDMSTSSGSDSEAEGNCPILVPRWPPINAQRHRKIYYRRSQRQDDSFKVPHQNVSGGWTVTLAGSCYTTLPSDVEMKVCFPKNAHNTTSQSDSGLGEEHNYSKQSGGGAAACKKCGNCEHMCQNCKTTKSCKCNTALVNKNENEGNEDSENQIFLPPAHQLRKGSHNSKTDNSESAKKYYHYLPDLKTKKKQAVKMARRFSLHCWLPEDRIADKTNVAKMEITETIGPINDDKLSVYGCAIMPEMKPRVPTMSERDLTRVHTAQFYSRHRQI